MKRHVCVTIVTGLVICLSSSLFAATYGGGSGTAEVPYLIATAEQMNSIGLNPADWGKCFKLMEDIDMAAYTGTQYNIIGGQSAPHYFSGTFDGNNHVIRNLTYTTSEKVFCVGLFGAVMNATIKDLGLENVTLATAGTWVGGLVGESYRSTIINCCTTGSVSGNSLVGGLVGQTNGDITSSYSACLVSGESGIGGLVGTSGEGKIASCYATGAVSGAEYAGGLAGSNDVGMITSCYATGAVNMTGIDENLNGAAGGLVGYNNGALVNCYATGAVNGNEDDYLCNNAGGLAGYNKHIITSCLATGAVAGGDSVGGLAGYNDGAIVASYASGSVSGDWAVGGLAGKNDGDITSSYATSRVEGRGQIGGLVGINNSSIASCYAAGAVESFDYGSVGGFVGQNSGMITAAYATGTVTGLIQYTGGLVGEDYFGSVVGSFWDNQTSGQPSSGGGTGKTTAELQTLLTFIDADWDFSTTEDPADWFMPPVSYPRLAWENAAPACGDAAHPYPKMDFTQDCRVDLADFAIFAASWLECSAMECD